MFIKNIYEGATYFHETNEICYLFVVLMKEKDFYFDTFARKIDDMDHYQHAYFTTSGKVLDFNRKMDTHVVTLFRQIIKEQQTIFTEEIIMAKLTTAEFIDAIKELSVLELNDLVKACEEEFGVSAAAGVVVAAAGGDAAAAEEKTEFDVELTEVGPNKVKVIKVVREITGLGLKEAKDAVDGAPKVIKEQADKASAEDAKAKLEAEGAKVTLK